MDIIKRLTLSAYGMHIADQIAIVGVPLIAALLFDASPETIGILVALQSMAHLLGSIPSGLAVDKIQPKTTALLSTIISIVAFLGVALSIYFESLIGFAITVLFSGFGTVLFVLVTLSIIPMIVEPQKMSRANSRIEIPRAISSFAIPLTIGLLINPNSAKFIFFLAVICAIAAFVIILRLPQLPKPARLQQNMWCLILEGGKYVLRHNLLRPIAACAIFWNIAFSALLVVIIPLIVGYFQADPGRFGIALAIFGSAAIIGSWLAGHLSERTSPNVILLFGPGSSALAILALLAIPESGPTEVIYFTFFFLGFGPSMWLISQNSIRQLATPHQLLGRVNAVIQTAIYGVRPLGALLGGVIAGSLSPYAGLVFVAIAFILSFFAALFSQLRTIRSFTEVSIEQAV
ncbi:MAG: MFS transporter [Chloroflexota bacterium]